MLIHLPALLRVHVPLPPDADVLGVTSRGGEIFLEVKTDKEADRSVDRYFYVFDAAGRYRDYPNLGYIDSLIVAGSLWHVFEDDMDAYKPNQKRLQWQT